MNWQSASLYDPSEDYGMGYLPVSQPQPYDYAEEERDLRRPNSALNAQELARLSELINISDPHPGTGYFPLQSAPDSEPWRNQQEPQAVIRTPKPEEVDRIGLERDPVTAFDVMPNPGKLLAGGAKLGGLAGILKYSKELEGVPNALRPVLEYIKQRIPVSKGFIQKLPTSLDDPVYIKTFESDVTPLINSVRKTPVSYAGGAEGVHEPLWNFRPRWVNPEIEEMANHMGLKKLAGDLIYSKQHGVETVLPHENTHLLIRRMTQPEVFPEVRQAAEAAVSPTGKPDRSLGQYFARKAGETYESLPDEVKQALQDVWPEYGIKPDAVNRWGEEYLAQLANPDVLTRWGWFNPAAPHAMRQRIGSADPLIERLLAKATDMARPNYPIPDEIEELLAREAAKAIAQ